MIAKPNRPVARTWVALGLLALAPAAGCDQRGDIQTMNAPQPAAQQKAEADARQAAYGPKGAGAKGGGPVAKPAEKPAEPAEKTAEEKK